MSLFSHKNYISNERAIPLVETDVFRDDDEALVAIKRLRPSEVVAADNPIALGYAQLRANVYIDQRHILDASHRRPDGGEHDDDDRRSVHYVGLENRGQGIAAVVGSMRLIEKSEVHPKPLPIEDFFGRELQGLEIGSGGFEVSRLISRNDIRRRQGMIRSALIGTGLAHAVANKWQPCLAVVEQDLEKILRLSGIPIRRATEPQVIEKYKSVNLGIEIDVEEFEHRMGRSIVDGMHLAEDAVNVVWRKQDEQKRAS